MKIAVIGTGKLGQKHLKAWSEFDGVEIVGVVARNQSRLEEIAKAYGTSPFTSLQELIEHTEVDVIDICTPTYTHYEIVKQAAQANKHVICEKPLALTSKEANEMIAVCEKHNVQLLVGHTLRFFPEYVNAKEQIENGAIGQPGIIRMFRGVPHPSSRNSWYMDEAKSGGLFVDLGVHEFDWLLWTFGDVERVMAKRVKHSTAEGESIEYGFVTLRMVDGTIAHVELSWAETAFRASFELAGNKGMITYNSEDSYPVSLQIRTQSATDSTGAQLPKSALRNDPYQRQFSHFLNCLLGKEKPVISAIDAMKALKVAEAAIQSADGGQPVIISEGVKLQ